MVKEAGGQAAAEFDPRNLLKSADFLKQEGEDVSEGLREFEAQILECLSEGTGFESSIPSALLAEVGAEIFDTLLSDYLKWYRSRIIAVRMPAEQDRLAFAGYAEIEKPFHVKLGIAYEMQNDGHETDGRGARAEPLHKLGIVPGSVKIVVDAAVTVRAAVAAMKIEHSINEMLADPAGIVRKTLECRLRHAYGVRERLGDIGLSIEDGIVNVAIYGDATD